MITHYIKYNGKKSSDFGLRLEDGVTFNVPDRRLELIEIDGVNGAKVDDKKSLSIVSRTFPFVLYENKSVRDVLTKINEWLFADKPEFKPLELSWDSGFIYYALFYETFKKPII